MISHSILSLFLHYTVNLLQALVTVDGNLGFLEGGTVDGVDVSALKDNVVHLQGDQIIDGLTVRMTKDCIYSKIITHSFSKKVYKYRSVCL